MKKYFSILVFVLANLLLVFGLFFSITGAIDINQQFAELAVREASGHELLGVGLDVLILGLALLSVVGFLAAVISWRIAQYRVIRTLSLVLCPLFILPILTCAVILTM